MARITWNQPGDKIVESGVDRGVLFVQNVYDEHPELFGGVPWNGMTSVVQKSEGASSSSVYFDGRKMRVDVVPGDFAATLTAMMYPDEFERCQGFEVVRRGVTLGQQQPTMFGLSWRTMIEDDLHNEHYKLHVAWNLIAVPSDKSYSTKNDAVEFAPMNWEITSAPQELPGVRPAAYLMFDSREMDPWLMEEIEAYLYGNERILPFQPSLLETFLLSRDWARFSVTDNGDGTWTGREARPGFITDLGGGDLRLDQVVVSYLDDDTFVIENTDDLFDITRLTVRDNLDETVTITSDSDIFTDLGGGDILIDNIELDLSAPEYFRISDQN